MSRPLTPDDVPAFPRADLARRDELLELAWGLIANAQGGNWDAASPEWREAAERWRDRYHEVLPPADAPASPEQPVYSKTLHEPGGATPLFMIHCDEGWRLSIVCEEMYEWAADWLLGVLGRRPYAPGRRP